MKYKCYIFDLDGTIYFGNQLADKANEVIEKARDLSQKIFFVTNNSAKTRKEIFEKLISLGINLTENELITSSYAIAKYLKDNNFSNVYCLGTKSLIEEIKLMGIEIVTNNPQAVIVGYNSDFKLSDLNELVNINIQNCKLIVANKERVYPKENGYILPGAGPIVAAVETLLNKKTDKVIGKPNIEMIDIAIKNYNFRPEEILVIGDSYESDIKMAQNYGAESILITNEKKDDCICINSLADLLEIIK